MLDEVMAAGVEGENSAVMLAAKGIGRGELTFHTLDSDSLRLQGQTVRLSRSPPDQYYIY